MRRMSLSIMVVVIVSCLAALSCTNADNANKVANTNASTATNTKTPVAIAPATSATPDPKFNLPYEAVRDTRWTSNPNPSTGSTPTTGTVAKGTKVFFDHIAPVTPTWQLAMFEDGTKKYVHPDDFKKL